MLVTHTVMLRHVQNVPAHRLCSSVCVQKLPGLDLQDTRVVENYHLLSRCQASSWFWAYENRLMMLQVCQKIHPTILCSTWRRLQACPQILQIHLSIPFCLVAWWCPPSQSWLQFWVRLYLWSCWFQISCPERRLGLCSNQLCSLILLVLALTEILSCRHWNLWDTAPDLVLASLNLL